MAKRSHAGTFLSPFHNRSHQTTSDQPGPNTALVSQPHKKMKVHSVSGSTGIFATIFVGLWGRLPTKVANFGIESSMHAASSCHVHVMLFNTERKKNRETPMNSQWANYVSGWTRFFAVVRQNITWQPRVCRRNLWRHLRTLMEVMYHLTAVWYLFLTTVNATADCTRLWEVFEYHTKSSKSYYLIKRMDISDTCTWNLRFAAAHYTDRIVGLSHAMT